ncbi:universal stress protein [Halarchaeum sp. P4]|uniref:universal stress protein n=1 Tax=Halarchaeum sp. P4 TaxID=3421639 RepID=UPI003EBE1D93
MYTQLLCPTDGSDASSAAVEAAVTFAAQVEADVTIVNVRTGDGTALDESAMVPTAAAEHAESVGVDVTTATIDADGPIHEAILRYAREIEADCIVMGTHARSGLQRFVLGSVTEMVLRESSVPVLTVHAETTLNPDIETLLVPTDGSDCAEAAARDAIDLARATWATLHVVHAVDPGAFGAELSESALDAIEEAGVRAVVSLADIAETNDVREVETAVLNGTPARTVVDYAHEHDVDCIVMGTHGRTGLERHLVGSVTERLVRLSDVPVLVTPNPANTTAE